MSLPILILLLFAGIGLIYIGAEGLVGGGSKLATRLHVAPMVIGLSVVAFGTSLPELTVSIYAVINGVQDIAVGNVVGSNIANVALILAASAVVFPVASRYMDVRDDVLIVIGITLAFIGFSFDGQLSRVDGIIMTAGIILYIYRLARSPTITPKVRTTVQDRPIPFYLMIILAGLIALAIGTHMFTRSAVSIARIFGISDLVIGATIVALGTSLPELATSLVAAFHKHSEIVLGNILGSNVFNLIAVMGIVPLIHPITVPDQARLVQMPLMLGLTIVLLPMLKFQRGIRRTSGIGLLLIYAIFTAYMYSNGGF